MREFQLNGVPFRVPSDADIAARAAAGETHEYIMIRVTDADPHAGSAELRARRLRTLCEDCGAICWVDPRGQERFAALTLELICVQCMIKRMKQRKAGLRS